MDYGEILKKSWKIIWRFKVLWIFGFLASCGKGSGGGGGGGGSAQSGGGTGGNGFQGGEFGEGINRFVDQLGTYFSNITTWEWILIVVGGLILITVLALLAMAVSTIGKIGLIRGAWKADEGVEKLGFGELLAGSWRYFWRVILFTVGLTVLGWIVGFLLLFPTLIFTVVTLGLGLCLLIPFAILFAWVLAIFVNQAVVAIVTEDLGVMEGVKRAWQLLRDNFVAYLVMGLILSVGMAVITILLAAPLIAIALPFIIGAIGASGAHSTIGLMEGGVVSLVLLCLYVPIMIVIGAMLEAYMWTAWTLVFRRLSGRLGEAVVESKPLKEANPWAPEAEPVRNIKPEPAAIPEPETVSSEEPEPGDATGPSAENAEEPQDSGDKVPQ